VLDEDACVRLSQITLADDADDADDATATGLYQVRMTASDGGALFLGTTRDDASLAGAVAATVIETRASDASDVFEVQRVRTFVPWRSA
jgi:hypothetical protein